MGCFLDFLLSLGFTPRAPHVGPSARVGKRREAGGIEPTAAHVNVAVGCWLLAVGCWQATKQLEKMEKQLKKKGIDAAMFAEDSLDKMREMEDNYIAEVRRTAGGAMVYEAS